VPSELKIVYFLVQTSHRTTRDGSRQGLNPKPLIYLNQSSAQTARPGSQIIKAMAEAKIMAEITNKLSSFDIRNRSPYPETKYGFKRAAVLLPLMLKNGELYLLLTKRSKNMRNHPSTVSFPGGMREENDLSDVDTALREAQEEIGLKPNTVQIVAVLTRGITLPNTIVYPVVGMIPNDFVPIPNPVEVDYTIVVPLKTFLDPKCVRYSEFKFRGRSIVNRSVFHQDEVHGVEVVWGFTANYCTFLAKIILENEDFLAIFNDSTYPLQNMASDLVEYFDFITSTSAVNSKL
ncbi:peroxisomal coenzyme A diphosphatase NUDT7, partial [Biomphalaria glabrata]